MNAARRTATTTALTALLAATGLVLVAPASADPGRAVPAPHRMDGRAMEQMMASQGEQGMANMMQRSPAMQRMHAQMMGGSPS